ncbi:MAG: hypothetical protein AAB621_01660 [Patescibacteria group bacterium]
MLYWIIGIIVVVLGGFFVFHNYVYNEKPITKVFAVSGLINPRTQLLGEGVNPGFGAEWRKNIFPDNFMADTRNDSLFFFIFTSTIAVFLFLFFSKIKIFGKTLIEYLSPIKKLILGAVLIVISQYTVNFYSPFWDNIFLRLSQLGWEIIIVASIYKLVKTYADFNFGNVLITGVLYSFIIHGLKVSIRYMIYGKTIFYALDRFLYGSLLVMAVTIASGVVFLYIWKKGEV